MPFKKQQNKIVTGLHKCFDTFLIVISFILAYMIKKYLLPEPFRGLYDVPNYYIPLLMIIIIWYISFHYFDIYSPHKNRTLGQIFWNLFKANITGMLFLTLFMYLLKVIDISRIMIGIFFWLNIALIGSSRILIIAFLKYFRSKTFNLRNILIVGCGQTSKDIIQTIQSKANGGLNVLGRIATHSDDKSTTARGPYKILGTVNQLNTILVKEAVDELIFTIPLNKIKHADRIIHLAEELGISIRIIPDWQIESIKNQPSFTTFTFDDFLNTPTIYLSTTPFQPSDLLVKGIIDYSFAGLVIAICSPLFLVIPLFIKLSSAGPVFFKQQRCGLNGRRFNLYKFRTMVKDADKIQKSLQDKNESKGPVFKIKKDPRIVPFVGTFLRKSGLDELPQLFNIIKGEMSLVGPRPPIPSEVDKYEIWQRRRLSMKPGLTCLWQISPNRNDIHFDDWMKMDLYYIDNWSLLMDFKILIKSIRTMITGSGR